MKNSNKKKKYELIMKIGIICLLAIYMPVFIFGAMLGKELPSVIAKYGNPIGIIIIGVMIFILPKMNQVSYTRSTKGDSLIRIIGIIAICYGVFMLFIAPLLT